MGENIIVWVEKDKDQKASVLGKLSSYAIKSWGIKQEKFWRINKEGIKNFKEVVGLRV